MVNGFSERVGGALVVGGSGAIGREVACGLAAMGTDLTLTWSGNEKAAQETATLVRERGRDVRVAQMDMGDAESVAACVERAAAQHGGLHTVVLAASPTNYQSYVSKMPIDLYAEQLRVDAGGSLAVVQHALPFLREARGAIVIVSSVANRRFVLRDVLSTGPKAANEALVRAVAAEEGRFGVRANAVGVGILAEGMTQVLIASGDIREGDLDHALSRIPLRQLGKARDVAEMACFLASERARYVTGQWIDVDGGYGL